MSLSKSLRNWLLKPVISSIHQLQRNINMNQAELAEALIGVNAAVTKVGAETTALIAKVAELEAAIAAAGNTTPEVDAALAAVKAAVQTVDDLVPDPVDPDPAP